MKRELSNPSDQRVYCNRRLFSCMIAVLSVVVLVASLSTEGMAQKKKKKKGKLSAEEIARQDSLAKVKYQFELNKNWSFGWENYKNKQYTEVPRYFWKVVEIDTTHRFKKVFNYLGQTYIQLEMPDSARYVWEEGIKVFPEDDGLRRSLAWIYALRDDIDQAISEYEAIQDLGKITEDDLRALAGLYVRTDQNEKAIKAFEDLLVINPDDVDAQNTLSTLYRVGGDEDKMIEMMETTLQQNPEDTQTRFNLAKVRFDRQEYETAIELLQKYLTIVPDDVFAIELMANAQQNLQQYRRAIATYKKVSALKPENKKVLVEIADCYRELGQYSNAVYYARKALRIDPQYGRAFIAIGQAYESSADKCSSKKPRRDFSDKLVYELAYREYRKAQSDLDTRADAKQRLQYVKQLIPTNEDRFMHKEQKKAKGGCYAWIYR